MARSISLELLSSLQVASPCAAQWESMSGDDRVRHCCQCNLRVYNLSAMPADEAAAIVQRSEGRVCIRLYKRADGTVITQDCPVGLRLLRMKAKQAVARIAAAGILLIAGGPAAATGSKEPRLPKLASLRPFSTIRAWLAPAAPTPPMMGNLSVVMGDRSIPSKPRTSAGSQEGR